MSFRIENKYEISIKKISNFFEFLKNKNAKQMYDKRKISSIYFDNKFKDSFHNSEEGVVPRKKWERKERVIVFQLCLVLASR